ncbi:MAG: amine oxidase [Neobacillus sp.]|jgi:protoporphyrinogen oxidase|nr:amine oxidase [Neobacillus sp.]
MSKNVAIIGGGPMGLTFAYELLKRGYKVDLYEKESQLGGMSAHFDFSGLDIEKYYHFVCGPDYPMFEIMKELGIFDKLKWTNTKMGLFYQGKLYKWGGPFELLAFPKANLIEKARYGLHVFCASKYKNWIRLDKLTALDWIKKWEGETGYQKFWDSLFNLKFYEIKHSIAAPWLWSRLARVAKSRKNIFQERMGYIEGGSKVVIDKLEDRILEMGGRIFLNSPVEKICIADKKVKGLVKDGQLVMCDSVISTIPIQYIKGITPNLPAKDRAKLEELDNVGVVCVIAKLKQQLTENFWLNITDKSMDIPGMIELSNLNTSLKDHILYVPFYLHKDNPMYQEPDENFINKVSQYIHKVNSALNKGNIIDIRVFRYEYAQPVCTTEFLKKLPDIQSSERQGFYIVDTAYCYPEDRSINESVKIARKVVDMIGKADEK